MATNISKIQLLVRLCKLQWLLPAQGESKGTSQVTPLGLAHDRDDANTIPPCCSGGACRSMGLWASIGTVEGAEGCSVAVPPLECEWKCFPSWPTNNIQSSLFIPKRFAKPVAMWGRSSGRITFPDGTYLPAVTTGFSVGFDTPGRTVAVAPPSSLQAVECFVGVLPGLPGVEVITTL